MSVIHKSTGFSHLFFFIEQTEARRTIFRKTQNQGQWGDSHPLRSNHLYKANQILLKELAALRSGEKKDFQTLMPQECSGTRSHALRLQAEVC